MLDYPRNSFCRFVDPFPSHRSVIHKEVEDSCNIRIVFDFSKHFIRIE